jgi:hypothetical protein
MNPELEIIDTLIKKNNKTFVYTQRIKGLIKGWENVSSGLRYSGRNDSADIIDRCI